MVLCRLVVRYSIKTRLAAVKVGLSDSGSRGRLLGFESLGF